MSTAIYKDQAVVVSYDSAAAGADAIEDTDGNAFQSFTSGEDGVDAAVNNSTQTFPTPSTPTNFSATEGDKRVILAWDPPAATDPITRHEYRYKTTGDYPGTWTEIPDSGPGGTNQAGYTVTGLTNGTAYTFQLRAANRQNQGTAAESTAVTPMAVSTPTPANFAAAPGNARVTLSWDPPAADSGVTRHEYGQKEGTGAYGEWMRIANSGVGEANQAGFTVTGLTNETAYTFQLRAVNADGESTAAEAGPVTPTPGICDRTQGMQDAILAAVSGVTDCEAVTVANLLGVSTLNGSTRNIAALKSDDFAGMPNLVLLYLAQNSLNTLPADMFSGLTNLLLINLSDNDLSSLPDGLFSGITGLTDLILGDNPDTGDTLPLTVTLEKVGSDRVRAKVLAGAPFAVAIPVTVANGTLAGGVTVLTVAAGSVESAPVTVTRTEGTTAAVTVDVDLSTQPMLPQDHAGYEFARAASGLPAEILPALGPPPDLEDLEVTLHLSDEDGSVLENHGWVTVTATASPASPVPFTVTVSAAPVAPATEDDFRLSTNRVLSFAANETGSTGTVRIGPIGDEDPEPDDVVRVSGAVSNPAIPDPDDVTLTIRNDDRDVRQDVAIDAPAAVEEDAGSAAVTVTLTTRRNSAPVVDVELYYYWRQETATRGEDYRPPPGQVFASNVLFATVPTSAYSPNAAGTAWVAQRSFTIGIVDDREAEGDETIVFRVETGSDESPNHTIAIRDDDTPVLRNVRLVSGPGSDGVWSTGERVEVEVRYSLPVVVERPDCWDSTATARAGRRVRTCWWHSAPTRARGTARGYRRRWRRMWAARGRTR